MRTIAVAFLAMAAIAALLVVGGLGGAIADRRRPRTPSTEDGAGRADANEPGADIGARDGHGAEEGAMTAAERDALIAQDNPAIVGYDQEAFVRRLYPDRPLGPSLAAFEAARDATAPILRRLTEEQWRRAGTHGESGRSSAEAWLRIYAGHAHDHADQIRRARAASRGHARDG